MRFFFIKIFFILILFITKTNSHERFAPSVCNNFITDVVENYSLIEDNFIINFENEIFGINFEEEWDPNLKDIDKFNDNKVSIGDLTYKRNKKNYIIIRNIHPQIVNDISLEIGDLIIKLNDKATLNLTDKQINKILEDSSELKIEYINKKGEKKIEKIKKLSINYSEKLINFNILSLNNIDTQNFNSEFLIDYNIRSEIWDGLNTDPKEDALFKIAKKNFYYEKDDIKSFISCEYTDEEFNQLQIYSPSDSVSLINLSYQDHLSSEKSKTIEVYEKDINYHLTSVDVNFNFKGLIRIFNDFDLRTFPFDKQKIVFKFLENDNSNVVLKPSWQVYANLHDLVNKSIIINGWKVNDYRIQNFNYKDSSFYANTYTSGLNIILEIERQSDYYIYKVILPIILILLVCWSAIWITPKEIESRLTITIVCLLSLIAYNFVIDAELPKLEYLTIMDWIIFVSYIFAAIPNFLCIIDHKLYSTNKKLCLRIDNTTKVFGPILYLILILMIILINVNTQPDHSSEFVKVIAGKL